MLNTWIIVQQICIIKFCYINNKKKTIFDFISCKNMGADTLLSVYFTIRILYYFALKKDTLL